MRGTHWYSKAVFGTLIWYNSLVNKILLCKVIFINWLMQKQYDINGKKVNSLQLFIPATFNPSRRVDFSVHQNTASCVLRHSKPSSCLKTTCPAGGWKRLPKSGLLQKIKMDVWWTRTVTKNRIRAVANQKTTQVPIDTFFAWQSKKMLNYYRFLKHQEWLIKQNLSFPFCLKERLNGQNW